MPNNNNFSVGFNKLITYVVYPSPPKMEWHGIHSLVFIQYLMIINRIHAVMGGGPINVLLTDIGVACITTRTFLMIPSEVFFGYHSISI